MKIQKLLVQLMTKIRCETKILNCKNMIALTPINGIKFLIVSGFIINK